MPAERPVVSIVGIGAQLGQNILGSFVPGRKEGRIEAEKNGEEALKGLDCAWHALGGESGKDVTMEQIKAVLTAKLKVLETPSLYRALPLFVNGHYSPPDKKLVKNALGLDGYGELYDAEDVMLEEQDRWRQTRNNFVSNPVSETERDEVERRIIACNSAAIFLSEFREKKFGYRPGRDY